MKNILDITFEKFINPDPVCRKKQKGGDKVLFLKVGIIGIVGYFVYRKMKEDESLEEIHRQYEVELIKKRWNEKLKG